MYRAVFGKIQAIEVIRTTEKMVVVAGSSFGEMKEARQAKETDWYSWHDTWEQAHARLLSDAQEKVEGLRSQLERANGDYGRIKGTKPPAQQESAP